METLNDIELVLNESQGLPWLFRINLVSFKTFKSLLFLNKKLVGYVFWKHGILTGLYAIVTDRTRIVVGSSSCFISNMDQAKENCRRGLKNLQHSMYRQSWPLKHPLKKRKCSKLENYIVPIFFTFRYSFMTDLKSIEGPYLRRSGNPGVRVVRNGVGILNLLLLIFQNLRPNHVVCTTEYCLKTALQLATEMLTFICRKHCQSRYIPIKES